MTGVPIRRWDSDTDTQRKTTWRHREKVTSMSQGERPRPEIQPSSTSLPKNQPPDNLVVDVCPPELRDNTFLMFKSPSLWDFVMAALTDQHGNHLLSILMSTAGFSFFFQKQPWSRKTTSHSPWGSTLSSKAQLSQSESKARKCNSLWHWFKISQVYQWWLEQW